jgi:hypothetical protein
MKTAIGHTNVYSSYGWLILARVRVLYVPNGYGSFLCLVYATSHLLFGGFCSYFFNMIIYNVFILFYSKKSIKTPFGALIFQKFGQMFPTPA